MSKMNSQPLRCGQVGGAAEVLWILEHHEEVQVTNQNANQFVHAAETII